MDIHFSIKILYVIIIYEFSPLFHQCLLPWIPWNKGPLDFNQSAHIGSKNCINGRMMSKASNGGIRKFFLSTHPYVKKMKFSQTFKWFTEIWPESAFHASSGLAPPKLHSHWKPQLLNYTLISTIFLIRIINNRICKSTTDKRTINSSLLGLLHYHSQITNDNNMQAISSSFFPI